MIKLENITKTFFTEDGNSIIANNHINLEVKDGEIFGIIGFSGAGKSTLLKNINLLEKPDSGKVIVDGVDLLSLPKKEQRTQLNKIGSIIQYVNLFDNLTVYDI